MRCAIQGWILNYVDNTVQVFLGTQIGCAQCHDHPFDRWTQKDFYQMASFTFGVETRHRREIEKNFRVEIRSIDCAMR